MGKKCCETFFFLLITITMTKPPPTTAMTSRSYSHNNGNGSVQESEIQTNNLDAIVSTSESVVPTFVFQRPRRRAVSPQSDENEDLPADKIVQETQTLLRMGDQMISLPPDPKDQRGYILVIGNTGAGKTTLTLFLSRPASQLTSYKKDGRGTNYLIKDDEDLIGRRTTVSESIFPNLIVDNRTEPPNRFYDCPGFDDTRSASVEIANMFFIRRVAAHASKLKILMIVNHASVMQGGSRVDFPNLLLQTVTLLNNKVSKFSGSVALIASKVKAQYETDFDIIDGIASFLNSTKHELTLNDWSLDERSSAVQLINGLLDDSGPEDLPFTRIGIFRQPTKPGPLSLIPAVVNAGVQLSHMLNRQLTFVQTGPDDFGFTLSDKARRVVGDLVTNVKDQIRAQMATLARQLGDLYGGQMDQLKNYISKASGNDDGEEADRILRIYQNVQHDVPFLATITHDNVARQQDQDSILSAFARIMNESVLSQLHLSTLSSSFSEGIRQNLMNISNLGDHLKFFADAQGKSESMNVGWLDSLSLVSSQLGSKMNALVHLVDTRWTAEKRLMDTMVSTLVASLQTLFKNELDHLQQIVRVVDSNGEWVSMSVESMTSNSKRFRNLHDDLDHLKQFAAQNSPEPIVTFFSRLMHGLEQKFSSSSTLAIHWPQNMSQIAYFQLLTDLSQLNDQQGNKLVNTVQEFRLPFQSTSTHFQQNLTSQTLTIEHHLLPKVKGRMAAIVTKVVADRREFYRSRRTRDIVQKWGFEMAAKEMTKEASHWEEVLEKCHKMAGQEDPPAQFLHEWFQDTSGEKWFYMQLLHEQYTSLFTALCSHTAMGTRQWSNSRDLCQPIKTVLLDYLHIFQPWYRLLSHLYSSLSHNDYQQQIERYNVADLTKWGLPIAEPPQQQQQSPGGINITLQNFNIFASQVIRQVEPTFNSNIFKSSAFLDEQRLTEFNKLVHWTLAHEEMETVTCDPDRNKVTFEGTFLRLSKVKRVTNDFTTIDCPSKSSTAAKNGIVMTIKIVEMLALDTVFLDADVAAEGKQLLMIIVAPKWEVVCGPRVINLNGLPAASHQKAADGQRLGFSGSHGRPGLPGGTAGSFVGMGMEFKSMEFLTVKLDGGTGGRGQEGGDGKEGMSGDRTTVSTSYGCMYGSIYGGGCNEECCLLKQSKFVLITVFYNILNDEQFYRIRDRRNVGQPGGKGGDGGLGGMGGKEGKFLLVNWNEPDHPCQLSLGATLKQQEGKRGEGGMGGKGGVEGLMGGAIIVSIISSYKLITLIPISLEPPRLAFVKNWDDDDMDQYLNDECEDDEVCRERAQRRRWFAESLKNGKQKLRRRSSDGQANRDSGFPIQEPNEVWSSRAFDSVMTSFELLLLRSQFRDVRGSHFLAEVSQKHGLVTESTVSSWKVNVWSFLDQLCLLETVLFRDQDTPPNLLVEQYKSLQKRLETVLFQHSAQSTETELNIVRHIHATVLSRICHLSAAVEPHLVLDVAGFFKLVGDELKEFKKTEKILAFHNAKDRYLAEIDAQIEEAEGLVNDHITVEIEQLHSKTGHQVDGLLVEINVLKSQVGQEIQGLTQLRAKLQKTLIVGQIVGALKIGSQFLTFLGPKGMAVAALIGGGLSLVQSHALPDGDAERSKIKTISIPEGVTNSLRMLKERVAQDGKKRRELFRLKLLTAASQLPKSSHADDANQHEVIITNKIGGILARMPPDDGSTSQPADSIDLDAINKDLDDTLESSISSLEKVYENQGDPGPQVVQRRATFLKGLVGCQNVLKSTLDTVARYQKDKGKLDEIGEALKGAQEKMEQLNEFRQKISSEFIPMMADFQKGLTAFTSGLGGQSQVSLIVGKWKVQESLKEFKMMIRNLMEGLSVEVTLERLIEKFEEGIITLIKVYDQIQIYQDRKSLATYMADLQLDSGPSLTGSAQTPLANDEEGRQISDLKQLIKSNVVTTKLAQAMNAFKQWVFPFAHKYLGGTAVGMGLNTSSSFKFPAESSTPRTILEATEATPTPAPFSVTSVVTEVETKITGIQRQLDAYKVKVVDYDKWLHDGDFDETEPFFVWTNDSHSEVIKELLEGKKVLLNANALQAPHEAMGKTKDAVKFTKIELKFRAALPKNQILGRLADQTKIDQAVAIQAELDGLVKLRELTVTMTHHGRSVYKYGQQLYAIGTDPQELSYSFQRKPWTSPPEPKVSNVVWDKLSKGDVMLSPYTFWSFQLLGRNDLTEFLAPYQGNVDMVLVGKGRYLMDLGQKGLPDLKLGLYYQNHVIE